MTKVSRWPTTVPIRPRVRGKRPQSVADRAIPLRIGEVARQRLEAAPPRKEPAVVGVERDLTTLEKARSRVAQAGLANVSFMAADVRQVQARESDDAVVGRLILEFLPDP